jgi:hypothetical protein
MEHGGEQRTGAERRGEQRRKRMNLDGANHSASES